LVSASTVDRILSAEGLLVSQKVRRHAAAERYVQAPTRPRELWATDILSVDGYGFFYLFRVMHAFSRYVVHWELRPIMTTDDAKAVSYPPFARVSSRLSTACACSTVTAPNLSLARSSAFSRT
jgi:transposase InsO family protein